MRRPWNLPALRKAPIWRPIWGRAIASAGSAAYRCGIVMVRLVLIDGSVGYKVINRTANVEIPSNIGDFKLMSRCVAEELRYSTEFHGFVRRLVALVGLKQAYFEYARATRFSEKGNNKRLFVSLTIDLNGIIGFSSLPLCLLFFGCAAIAGLSFASAIVTTSLKLLSGLNYPMGIPAVTVLVLFMSGVQFILIRLLGEYRERIYDEVRRRRVRLIDEAVNVTVRSRHATEDCSV
jgi:polyisoprenyl-phosphate glycosyltransferase